METNSNVLIIDDEMMLREAISAFFTKMGCKIYQADNGQDALEIFAANRIDFVILDLMLPGMPGEDVCKEIRRRSRVPIIMLTAKTQEDSIINGLSIGADDYVTKPFSVKELYARMEAIKRRVPDVKNTSQKIVRSENGLEINIREAIALKNGSEINLTKSEWKILSAMALNPGKVFSRDELMEIVFGDDSDSYDRVIDTHIKNLRKKIESDPKSPVYIKTVHGLGYKFGGSQ